MASDDIHSPDFLADLERERSYVESRSGSGSVNRLKLDRGQRALVRYLPFRFNAKGIWFLRVGWHWVNQVPYVCAKESSPEAGGGHERCEICDLVDDFAKSANDRVSDKARKMQLMPQWLVYSLLYERDDGQGDRNIITKASKIHEPWENWFYRSDFMTLLSIYERYLKRTPKSGLSILDPFDGCDVWMEKTRKGLAFDREDSQPLGKTKEDTEAILEKAFDALKKRKEYRPLTGDKLDDLLVKIEDVLRGGGRRRDDDDDRRGGRDDDRRSSRDDDRRSSRDDDRRSSRDDDRRSSRDDDRRSSRDDDRSSRSSRSHDLNEDDDRRSSSRDDDRRSSRDDDRRSSRDDDRRSSNDDRRSSSRDSDRRSSSREEEPRSRSSREEEPRSRSSDRDDQRSRNDEPRASNRDEVDGGDTSIPDGEEEGAEVTTVRRAGDLPPPPARGEVSSARRSGQDDEDDNLPPDDRDRLAADKPRPDEIIDARSDAKATPAASKASDAPPPVRSGSLGADIRNSLRGFNSQGR
jgi:hypothetical protein